MVRYWYPKFSNIKVKNIIHKCIWLMRLTSQGFTVIFFSQNTKPFIPSWYLVSENTENINIIENECLETEARTKYFRFEWMFN